MALIGGGVGILYSAPYVRLAGRGLGEIGIVVAFGPLLVAGAALVQTGTIGLNALLAGIPTGILTGLIIWINQFPDALGDAAGGKRTLVVRLGLENARWGYVISWALSYAFLIGLVVGSVLPGGALLGLVTLPYALYLTRHMFQNYRLRSIKQTMAGTINLHITTGLMMILGVGLDIYVL